MFKPRHRLPALVGQAARITPLADLPGLQVCRRTVLSARRHRELLRRYPDLTYAVLMPWVEGPTWMQVLGEKRALSPEQSLSLARTLVEILATMEEHGLAHCDLSGSNLMLPALLPSPAGGEGVALVDVEQLYSSDLKRPEVLTVGSDGYAHRSAPQELWGSAADRFAGAVLLAEMLGWCDEQVREAAWGETYFEPAEMQRDVERFRLLLKMLHDRWNHEVPILFQKAWVSERLRDCPTFEQWLSALPASLDETNATQIESAPIDETLVDVSEPTWKTVVDDSEEGESASALESTAQSLYLALKEQLSQGNWREAERLGEALKVLLPGYEDSEELLAEARSGLQEEARVGERIKDLKRALETRKTELAAERSELEEERRSLEEALRKVKRREAELHNREQSLLEAQQNLSTAQELLERHRCREAEQLLEVLSTPQAEAEDQIDVDEEDGTEAQPPSLGSTTAQEWTNQLKEVHCFRHPPLFQHRPLLSWASRKIMVTSVAFSPDETFFAAADTFRQVRIWRPNGELSFSVACHTAEVLCVDISPDGELLALARKDNHVGLFDLSSRSWTTLKGHTGWIRSVVFAPKRAIVASGAEDATIRIWQLPEGRLLKVLRGHEDSVTSLDFSPDGTLLASGSADQTVRIWDVSEIKEQPPKSDLGTIRIIDSQLSDPVGSVAFSPTGELLATGGSDGTIQLLRVEDGELESALSGHRGGVESIAFSPGGEILASGGRDGRVRLWQVPDGQALRTIEYPEGTIVSSVTISNSGKWLLFGLSDGTARLWETTRPD